MNNKSYEEFKNLRIEDIIWYIYFFIILINLIANKMEEQNLEGAHNNKKTIKNLHLISLGIAFIFYIYFVFRKLEFFKLARTAKERETAGLLLFAAILFLIGGAVYLFVELNRNIDPEEGIPI